MIHNTKNLAKNLIQKQTFQFSGLFDKRKPTPKDLDKYDVIWVGANLGGIASRHFDHVVHGKYKMSVVFDNNINQAFPIRCAYEMQRALKSDYLLNSKLAINMYTAHSDGVGIKEVLPEQNKIILRNGREIKYDHIVFACGMNENFESIKNFDEAWQHHEHPFYVAKDHPSWRSFLHKYPKYHYNFTNGNAYFYIPKYPFRGEVETYNFFVSTDVWRQFKAHGKLHPHANLTIINANNKFVQYNDSADQFIKEKLDKHGVKVEYGKELIGIDMKNFQLNIKDSATGKEESREYHNAYSMIPCTPHPFLQSAGLLSSNGLLDVDPHTLQHKKYKNIFGLGDVCDLPTTKTFFGGWHQIHVVRNNLQRSLQNQTLNAHYDGFTTVPLYLSQSTVTWVEHRYDNKNTWKHLKEAGPLNSLWNMQWGRNRKKFLDFYLFKTWGPPYHKLKKTFKELPGSPEANAPKQGLFDKYFAKKEAHH